MQQSVAILCGCSLHAVRAQSLVLLAVLLVRAWKLSAKRSHPGEFPPTYCNCIRRRATAVLRVVTSNGWKPLVDHEYWLRLASELAVRLNVTTCDGGFYIAMWLACGDIHIVFKLHKHTARLTHMLPHIHMDLFTHIFEHKALYSSTAAMISLRP